MLTGLGVYNRLKESIDYLDIDLKVNASFRVPFSITAI